MSETISFPRARAWLLTAVNPLLRMLPIEKGYLEREQWTWRFHLRQCELLQPCRDIVGGVYVDNLDDLAARQPNIAAAIDAHDGDLEELVKALSAAQRALESNPVFQAAVEAAREAHREAHPSDTPWGAFSPDKLLPLAAQFALNNVDPELARVSDSTMREFWADHHASLAQYGEPHFETIRPRGRKLLASVQKLHGDLKRFRNELCHAHDLPPVPVD